MGFSCGIVGLPNVGKSTIFNALSSAKAQAENFPFCTIKPNTATISVSDPRLKVLADFNKSEKIIPTQITFVDIAGLIKGASKGEGMGNEFLGHIRSVDAIAHVVRCFEDDQVIHVDGSVDPVRDIEVINTELLLSDLDSVQKQVVKAEKNAKSGNKVALAELDCWRKLETWLASGKLASSFLFEGDADIHKRCLSNLITAKPCLIVGNVSEQDANYQLGSGTNPRIEAVKRYCDEHGHPFVIISGRVEAEIAELEPEERHAYLESLGLIESGLARLARAGYALLDLITFFTSGPQETRAWTAAAGSSAPHCAGKIHTDFEKGFIRAEVISYQDYVSYGSELKVKEAGRLRVEGKEYIMQDGDVVHFRFNV